MKRAVFIAPSLLLGGAERSLVRAIAAIQTSVERVDVIVLADITSAMAAELPKGTGLHVLRSLTSGSPWAWAKVRRLLKAWKPQAVIGWSTYANFVTIISTRGLQIQTVVVSERNYVPKIVRAEGVGRIRRYVIVHLMKFLYRKADVITANSADGLGFLKKFIGPGPRYAQLPNTIDMEEVEASAVALPEVVPIATEGPRLLAMGRLQPQKGFDLLLEAMAYIRKSSPWHLVLVGDGPEKGSLQELACKLGIEDAVQWIGAVSNPFPYYRWADLIIVPSRFEGFPNVALEAMSCGRTVISTNCKTGPRELTCHGRYGILIPTEDVPSMTHAILKWGMDVEGRNTLGRRAQHHVRTTYDMCHLRGTYAHVLLSKLNGPVSSAHPRVGGLQ